MDSAVLTVNSHKHLNSFAQNAKGHLEQFAAFIAEHLRLKSNC